MFYIGDSISRCTRNLVTSVSGGAILCDGLATSKALDNPFLQDLIKLNARQLPGEDAVLINNGLYGWHLEDETDYPENYDCLLCFLERCFPGTPIFFFLLPGWQIPGAMPVFR